jgi:LEA14-like dessication related protein
MNPALRKTILGVGIVASVAAIGYGVYLFYKRQVALALQYCYKLSGIKIFHVRKDSINFEITVKIQNKSNVTVTMNGYDLDIYMNEKKIANVKSERRFIIAQTGVSEVAFEVDFDPSKVFDAKYLLNLLAYWLTDQTKIVLRVTGSLNLSMDFIRMKDFKFDYQTTISEIVNSAPDANLKCDIT